MRLIVAFALLEALLLPSVASAANIFCKYERIPSSIVCVDQGKTKPIFSFSLGVSPDFLDFLRTRNAGYKTVVEGSPESFRKELETFREKIEDAREEAEKIRKKNPRDLSLYIEILSVYSHGFSMYKESIGTYKEAVHVRI